LRVLNRQRQLNLLAPVTALLQHLSEPFGIQNICSP
jgi:hypothetical protein